MDRTKARMSADAMAAVEGAVKEGHSVFCLEQIGVPQRVINLLYDSGIKSVSDLVSRSSDQLLKIPNMGKAQLAVVLEALSKYHTIEDI